MLTAAPCRAPVWTLGTEFPIVFSEGVRVPSGMILIDSTETLAETVVSVCKGITPLSELA